MKRSIAYGAIAASALTGAAAGAEVFAEETEIVLNADPNTAVEIEGSDWLLPSDPFETKETAHFIGADSKKENGEVAIKNEAPEPAESSVDASNKTKVSQSEISKDLDPGSAAPFGTNGAVFTPNHDAVNKTAGMKGVALDLTQNPEPTGEADQKTAPESGLLQDEMKEQPVSQSEDSQKKIGVDGWNESKTGYYRDGVLLTGIQTIDDELYYFNEDGVLQYGQQKTDLNDEHSWVCADLHTGILMRGFHTLTEEYGDPGKTVFYDLTGYMHFGWLNYQNQYYYFDNISGAMQTGQKNLDGKWYCFDNDSGAMKTGLIWLDRSYQPDGEKTVYYNPSGSIQEGLGQMLYGLQKCGNDERYFNESDGSMAVRKWLDTTRDGVQGKVFFDETGVLSKGEREAAPGKWYYFDRQTGLMLHGFKTLSVAEDHTDQDKIVYYGHEGHMLYGQQRIGGFWYCFDRGNGAMKTGLTMLDRSYEKSGQKRVFYQTQGTVENGLGRMLYGEIRTNGRLFFADPVSGALKNAYVVKENDVLHIYGYDGLPGKNIQGEFEGGWYYFDQDGRIVKNTLITLSREQTDDGPKTVYYGSDGRMVYGMFRVDGNWKYFKPGSGAMCVNEFVDVPSSLSSSGKGGIRYFDGAGSMVTGSLQKGRALLAFDSNGILTACDYNGVSYFSQLDPRWSGTYVGGRTMAGSGCVPTVLAMIVETLKSISINPLSVANDLYQNGYMNHRIPGCGADAVVFAGSLYGLNVVQLNSASAIEKFLKMGALVAAAMNPGIFTIPGYTHEILLYGFHQGLTNVHDPYQSSKNGTYSISTIYGQRSTDPDDCLYGSPFFAFLPM